MTPKNIYAQNVDEAFCKRRSIVSHLSLAALITFSAGIHLGYAQEDAEDDEETEEVFELDAFVVEGSIRESLIEGVEIKRQSYQMIDALVAEDIGKFPDNNVVEALQRVAGVQVTDRAGGEVSTVAIRGLSDIATTVNGRSMFTAASRYMSLQDIPASLLNRVDVYKTRSAAELEQGIAGCLDIKTQRPFYFDGEKAVISYRGTYQELADSFNPNISALYSNTWENKNGAKFGALFNLSYVKTDFKDESVTAGAMLPFMTEDAPDGYTAYQRNFDTTTWTPGLENGLDTEPGSTLTFPDGEYEYVLSRDAVFGSVVDGERERTGANLSLQYAPNEDSEYTFEAFYTGYESTTYTQLHFSFVDWWGDLSDDPSADIELYPDTNIVKSRDNIGSVYGFQSGDVVVGSTDSYMLALGGQWNIGDKLKVTADLSYQDTSYENHFLAMRMDQVYEEIDVDFNDNYSGTPSWNFGDSDSLTELDDWNIAQLYDSKYVSSGDAVEFLIDADYDLNWGIFDVLKFGGRYDVRGATYWDGSLYDDYGSDPYLGSSLANYPDLAYLTTDFFDGRADVPSTMLMPNALWAIDNLEEVYSYYGLDDYYGYELYETFDVEETTTALYAMTEFKTELFGKNLDGQIGVRYVNVKTDMNFEGEESSVTTDDIMPSFTVRYDFTPQFRARLSYGETLRRPDFDDLNPNITYTEDVTNIGYGTATGGNPDLEATTSKNYDLSFEYYFGKRAGTIYASLFRREIEGLVISFRNQVYYDDYLYILSQPDNASNGELEGIELGWVYFPDDLPAFLDGLGVQASFTWLDSSQDIPLTDDSGEVIGTQTTPFFGVSDFSYSVVLAYERPRWSSRLSYVWRDDWLNSYESASFANPLGIWRTDQQSLDFQLTYNVNENLRLTFDATNLTDDVYQSYYVDATTNNFGSWLISRTFSVGARYAF